MELNTQVLITIDGLEKLNAVEIHDRITSLRKLVKEIYLNIGGPVFESFLVDIDSIVPYRGGIAKMYCVLLINCNKYYQHILEDLGYTIGSNDQFDEKIWDRVHQHVNNKLY